MKLRDRYRKVIEELAQVTDQEEENIAQEVVWLVNEASQRAEQETDRERESRATHVGFYLLDDGRAILENRLNCPPTLERALLSVAAHSSCAYIPGIHLGIHNTDRTQHHQLCLLCRWDATPDDRQGILVLDTYLGGGRKTRAHRRSIDLTLQSAFRQNTT